MEDKDKEEGQDADDQAGAVTTSLMDDIPKHFPPHALHNMLLLDEAMKPSIPHLPEQI
jgi:hypothetical protein